MALLGFWFQRDHASKADELYQKGEKQKAAELYLRARQYEQAAEVFADLEEIDQAVESYLHGHQPLKAAELLDQRGDHRGAITHYEKAGAFRQAAETALKARQHERAGRNFERASMHRRAAETFAAMGEHARALRAWEMEISLLRQRPDVDTSPAVRAEIREIDTLRAEVLENLQRFGEAAEILRHQGSMSAVKAGELFRRDKRFAEAAEAFLEANHTDAAFEAVEQAEGTDDALRATIYLRCDKHKEAGEILQRMGRLEEAAAAFEQAGAWEEAAKLFEQAENPKQAAEHFYRAGRYDDAARCYVKVNMYQEAAAAYVRIQEHELAAQAYREARMLLHAGNAFLKAKMSEPAHDVLMQIPQEDADYAQASLLLVPLLLGQGLIEGAAHRLEVLKKEAASGHASFPLHMRWYWQGRIEEERGLSKEAETSYQKVLAETRDFRDTSSRLEALRQQVTSGGTAPHAVPRRTSPPSGVIPDEMLTTPMPPPSASVPDLSNEPIVIQSQLDPWWDGVSVFHALDRRSRLPILLVTFPEGFVPLGTNLRHIMGRYTGFGFEEVLTLHEVRTAGGHVLLLYETFQGLTLAQRLAGEELPAAVRLAVLRQLCEGLSAGHKVNITHQWLSPHTVLVDDEHRVKIVGFGLRDILAEHDHTSRDYLSPETQEGIPPSPASDVFSLGLLGVELFQAFLPVDWKRSGELEPQDVGWPSEIEQVVPTAVRKLLVRCLRADPGRRPAADRILDALAEVGFVPGQILAERYEIQGELGRGGMSRVYRALDRQFDEEVAIKTMLNAAAPASQEERERLFREVQICRKISHPNVVRVHDFGEIPGGVFVIMEYLDGAGLDEIIENEAPLKLTRVQTILKEIAAALGEAHRLKVVHRDLKPANVMLVEERVKVMDFGIAHMSDGRSKHLTKAGEVIGSPLYMAPEQIQGLPLEGTCDLYALGVIAFGLLTGHEPFQAETATAVIFKHLHEEPPDVFQFRKDLPHAWKGLLGMLLAKAPRDRYQSAEELIEALGALPV